MISCEESAVNSFEDDIVSDPEWNGFKIVGDNIDKTVKPRYVRFDRQTSSLHYFHSYAVKDRVNLTNHSDSLPLPPDAPNLMSLLPSTNDISEIKHLFEIHVSRIIVEHIPFMKSAFGDTVEWHIQHKYYKEMGGKSDTVSLRDVFTTVRRLAAAFVLLSYI